MLSLFKTKPPLDDETRQWLFDAFNWALTNFGSDVFSKETVLVTPTGTHFPGSANNIRDMARLTFEHVQRHAGITHWPCQVVDVNTWQGDIPPPMLSHDGLRGKNATLAALPNQAIVVPYNPHQVNKPEALVASYTHVLAHYMGEYAKTAPPGGGDFWPQAREILGVFMGFGIMFANTAYTFRGGCGSCYNPLAERTAILNQDEITYALAIFCALKNIEPGAVLPHLKRYLRPVYKKCYADVMRRNEALGTLARLIAPAPRLGPK